MKRALIINYEPDVRLNLRFVLETEGYHVTEVASAVMARDKLLSDLFDLAIIDLALPGLDGLQLLEQIREAGVATAALVLTAQARVPDAVRAMKLGAIDFLEKPPQFGELRRLLAEAVGHHVERREQGEFDDRESHLQAAQQQIELRHFARAEKHLQRVLELEAHSPEVLNLLGVFAELAGDLRAARKFYGRALRAEHDHEATGPNVGGGYHLLRGDLGQRGGCARR